MALLGPAALADHHQVDQFDSSVASLDQWLKQRARANMSSGASRTYVVCDGTAVVGYHALSSGAVAVARTVGRFRRNMPDPIPVAILARLAVARTHQGQGLGRGLFRDAARRVLDAADIIGIRGLLVDAISPEARECYLALGMVPSLLAPMTLMITLADLRASLLSVSSDSG